MPDPGSRHAGGFRGPQQQRRLRRRRGVAQGVVLIGGTHRLALAGRSGLDGNGREPMVLDLQRLRPHRRSTSVACSALASGSEARLTGCGPASLDSRVARTSKGLLRGRRKVNSQVSSSGGRPGGKLLLDRPSPGGDRLLVCPQRPAQRGIAAMREADHQAVDPHRRRRRAAEPIILPQRFIARTGLDLQHRGIARLAVLQGDLQSGGAGVVAEEQLAGRLGQQVDLGRRRAGPGRRG